MVAGSCYYITDTENPDTFFNFAERYVHVICGPQKRQKIPYWLAAVSAFMGGLLFRLTSRLTFFSWKPTLTLDGLNTITQDFYFSSAKAARELGYRPLFTEDEAFSITSAWLKETRPWAV